MIVETVLAQGVPRTFFDLRLVSKHYNGLVTTVAMLTQAKSSDRQLSGTRSRSLQCGSSARDVKNLGKSKDPNTIYSNKGDAWHGAIIHTDKNNDLAHQDECDLVAKTRTDLPGPVSLPFGKWSETILSEYLDESKLIIPLITF